MAWPEPVTLNGAQCQLLPLADEHVHGLIEAAKDGELWSLWYTHVPPPERMAAEIERRLRLQALGGMLPFTVIDATGRVVGMTSFMNIDAVNKRVEIGGTWYARSVQRTGLNTACKTMLLTRAFEALDCIAVEFRTHRLNRQSRAAIERLGAQLDGVLRAHQRLADGSLRDTAVYSITAADWPAVKAHLSWHGRDRPC